MDGTVTITNLLLVATLEAGGARVDRVEPPSDGERLSTLFVEMEHFDPEELASSFVALADRIRGLAEVPRTRDIENLYDWSVLKRIDDRLERAKRVVAPKHRRRA